MFAYLLKQIFSKFHWVDKKVSLEVSVGVLNDLIPKYPHLNGLMSKLSGEIGSELFNEQIVIAVSAASDALVFAKAIDETADSEFKQCVNDCISSIPRNGFSPEFVACIFERDQELSIYTDFIDPVVLKERRKFLRDKIYEHGHP